MSDCMLLISTIESNLKFQNISRDIVRHLNTVSIYKTFCLMIDGQRNSEDSIVILDKSFSSYF